MKSERDRKEGGPEERRSEPTGWEAVPRREMWAWAWLTVCIVWLAYGLLFFTRDRWWDVAVAACFAGMAAWVVIRERKSRKEKRDGDNAGGF